MKITIISPSYPSNENRHSFGFVHARSKIYTKLGLSVNVIVPYIAINSKNEITNYYYEGISVHKVPFRYLKEVLDFLDPDVVAYHFPQPLILRELISLNRPMVIWVHGADVLIRFIHSYFIPYHYKELIRGLESILYDVGRNLLLRKLLLSKPQVHLVFPSLWMKNMFEKYVLYNGKMFFNSYVIPNPVDTDTFKPLIKCDKKDRKLAISVRALHFQYGVDIAVKAFARMDKARLLIIGNGPMKGFLEYIANKFEANVKFLYEGIPHSELPTFYNKAGVFIAPSRTESQGVAMCEALASGTPVIATRVGGIPEFVKHGYNGILIPKNNPVALRAAVLKVLHFDMDKYCLLSHNARKYAVRKFSHRVVIPREIQTMKRALQEFG